MTIYTSKIVIALLFYRLSVSRHVAAVLAAACGVFCLVAVMILGLQSDIVAPWLQTHANEGNIVCRHNTSELLEQRLIDLSFPDGLRSKHLAAF